MYVIKAQTGFAASPSLSTVTMNCEIFTAILTIQHKTFSNYVEIYKLNILCSL